MSLLPWVYTTGPYWKYALAGRALRLAKNAIYPYAGTAALTYKAIQRKNELKQNTNMTYGGNPWDINENPKYWLRDQKRKRDYYQGQPGAAKKRVRTILKTVRARRAKKIIFKHKRLRQRKSHGRYNRKGKGHRWGGQKNESGETAMILYKPSKNFGMIRKLGAPFTQISTKPIVNQIVSNTTDGRPNDQLIVVMDSYLKTSDLLAYYTSYVQYTGNVGGSNLQLRPQVNALGNGVKYYHKSTNIKFVLSNAAPSDCVGCVYIVMPKSTGVLRNPKTDWENAVTSERNQDPATANNLQTNPGCKPTDFKQWNMEWKILKKFYISLASGAETTLQFHFGVNRSFDIDYLGLFQQIKGITIQAFFVGKGQLVDSSADISMGTIKYSPIKLVAAQTVKNTGYCYVQYSRRTELINQLNDTWGGFVQDENSGAPDNVLTAANYA